MKTDVQIQKNVMDELRWEPSLDSAQIGVAVKDGIVTLAGQVDSYFKKIIAERAAKKVSGVKAVAEDIQVGPSPSFSRTDTDIAAAAINALKWNAAVRDEKIKVRVENGIVRLDGEVEWEYERSQAVKSVEPLIGVKQVLNLITLKPRLSPDGIKQKISAAFDRHATIDSKAIDVAVSGARVTLNGKVRSFAEKIDAVDAAWAAPGVISVENNLKVEVPEYAYD